MNKLDIMVAQAGEAMGIERMTDEQLQFVIRDAEEASQNAIEMCADATKYMVQAMACYAERDARRAVALPSAVCWEHYPDGTSYRIPFVVRVF